MKLSNLMLVAVFALVSACTFFKAETTGQRYFALKQDYATTLSVAEAYVENCRQNVTTECKETSEKIQKADKTLFALFTDADVAWQAKDDVKLEGYLDVIETQLGKLKGLKGD